MLKKVWIHSKRWLIAFFMVTAAMTIGIPYAIANPTVIGVDGTTVHIPMLAPVFDAVAGALEVNHGELKHLPNYDVVKVDYPQSFGLLTLGGPGYDKSISIGTQKTLSEIKTAQKGDLSVPVRLACYSQGADVCSRANDILRESGYDQSNVSYLLLGNVDNAEGGSKVRFPLIGKNGIFIPFAGVTLGTATPTTASDATITQLLYEYDGFARAPEYPLNLLADLNVVVGTLFEHGSYRWANPYSPNNIVSTTPDGKITNIMIPVNEVPILSLARFLGMPRVVANVLNPTVKALIDTAYGPVPNGPGTYPTGATPFKLFPSKEKRQANIESVREGLLESREVLKSVISKGKQRHPIRNTILARSQPSHTTSTTVAKRQSSTLRASSAPARHNQESHNRSPKNRSKRH